MPVPARRQRCAILLQTWLQINTRTRADFPNFDFAFGKSTSFFVTASATANSRQTPKHPGALRGISLTCSNESRAAHARVRAIHIPRLRAVDSAACRSLVFPQAAPPAGWHYACSVRRSSVVTGAPTRRFHKRAQTSRRGKHDCRAICSIGSAATHAGELQERPQRQHPHCYR